MSKIEVMFIVARGEERFYFIYDRNTAQLYIFGTLPKLIICSDYMFYARKYNNVGTYRFFSASIDCTVYIININKLQLNIKFTTLTHCNIKFPNCEPSGPAPITRVTTGRD
jgi:hypothetical protein